MQSQANPPTRNYSTQNARKCAPRDHSHCSKTCVMQFSRDSLWTGRMPNFREMGWETAVNGPQDISMSVCLSVAWSPWTTRPHH